MDRIEDFSEPGPTPADLRHLAEAIGRSWQGPLADLAVAQILGSAGLIERLLRENAQRQALFRRVWLRCNEPLGIVED